MRRNSPSLHTWFRVIAVGLVLVVLLGVSRFVFDEWRQLQRADQALAAVQRLRVALVLAEMVSRERGPTNGVLGASDPARATPEVLAAQAVVRERLGQARARTDAAVDAFQAALAADGGEAMLPRELRQAQAFRSALQLARAEVDRLAGLPHAQRSAEGIRQVVQGMVDLVPTLSPTISQFANAAQLADPSLSALVWGARLSAELREYAGLQGSLFTPGLTRQQPFSRAELAAIHVVRGRIEALRQLLTLRIGYGESSGRIVQAYVEVERHYFGSAAQLLRSVLAAGEADGRYGLTPAEFAARYVPDMDAIVHLRDVMLDEAALRSVGLRQQSRESLAWMVALTSTMLALVAGMIYLTRRRIILPLSQMARALRAMGEGELAPELPRPRVNDEMAAVIGGIAALQQQSQARAELERERDKLIDSLREQSITDFLTGLPNRRAFFAGADPELARAQRHGFNLVVLLMDVDHFKSVNDSAGHAAGDRALVAVATRLRHTMRQGDLAARLGGEEFVVLLSHCGLEDGRLFAERLREAIAAQVIDLGGAHAPLRLTVSIGLADTQSHGHDLATLLSRADDAMYEAKRAGRNQTMVAAA